MSPGGDAAEGKHGFEFDPNLGFERADPSSLAAEYDLLLLPAKNAPEALRSEAPVAADIVAAFDDRGRPIASICHGVQLLISADVIDGRSVAGYWTLKVDVENAGASFVDEAVVVDDNLVTARHPDDIPAWLPKVLSVAVSARSDAAGR